MKKHSVGRPLEEYWQELRRVSINQIIWCKQFSATTVYRFVVWDMESLKNLA